MMPENCSHLTEWPLALPPGRFSLTGAADDELRATCGAPPRTGSIAHPGVTFVAALGGVGMPVADILARCGCSIEAGPVLASCDLDWARPLHVDAVYEVVGEVTFKQRKNSRRFGAADHLNLRFAISLDGEHHALLRLHMIVPVPVEVI
jgi:hypothetical protein